MSQTVTVGNQWIPAGWNGYMAAKQMPGGQALLAAGTTPEPIHAGLVDLNLNSAPAFVIESVSGIDAPTAARIVQAREQIGGQFASLEDLDLVLDLTEETLAKLRDVAVFVSR